jgi:hypothetical protein
MTVLQIYNEVLAELTKKGFPPFDLETFVISLNKSIRTLANARYTMYAVNQQLTDDLRVLLKSYKYDGDFVATQVTVTGVGPVASNGLCYENFIVDTTVGLEVGDVITVDGYNNLFTISALTATTVTTEECIPINNPN